MTSLQDMGGHRTASVINSVRINQSVVKVCTTGLDEGNNAIVCYNLVSELSMQRPALTFL